MSPLASLSFTLCIPLSSHLYPATNNPFISKICTATLQLRVSSLPTPSHTCALRVPPPPRSPGSLVSFVTPSHPLSPSLALLSTLQRPCPLPPPSPLTASECNPSHPLCRSTCQPFLPSQSSLQIGQPPLPTPPPPQGPFPRLYDTPHTPILLQCVCPVQHIIYKP